MAMISSLVHSASIFVVALFLSLFLLDVSWESFFLHKRKLLISFLVFFFPPLIGCGMHSRLLECGFAVTIITDIYECSVFSLIPSILFLSRQFFLLYSADYVLFWNNFFYVFCIVCLYYSITILSQKLFKKEGMGAGDMYFIAALSSYIDPLRIMFIFFLASFLGVCYGLFYFLLYQKSLEGIPFIPLLYVATSVVQYDSIYFLLNEFFI